MIVYTKPHCPGCTGTKRRMDKLGIPYEELPIMEHIDYIKALGYAEAPVVEVDCGDGATAHWSGFRYDYIQQLYATLRYKLIAGKVSVPESA